jgi:hypothetical protein
MTIPLFAKSAGEFGLEQRFSTDVNAFAQWFTDGESSHLTLPLQIVPGPPLARPAALAQ